MLLIFDCDGVLVDSELLAHRALAELMTALGRPMTAQEAVHVFAGRRLQDVLASAQALLSAPIPADIGAQTGRRLLDTFRRELRPMPGAHEAITGLPYARCVASSSSRERIALSLDVTGLAPLFGARVFSADLVENGKPAPDLFLFAARSLGAAPAECIVIEDSVLGVRAGKAVGMATIGFIGASHATAQLGDELAAAGADVVIAAMAELPAAVERLIDQLGVPSRSASS